MGIRKTIERLGDVLGSEDPKKMKRAKAITKLVGKLEKKEAKLRDKLEKAGPGKEREKLERKIKLCAAQRKRGTQALQELR